MDQFKAWCTRKLKERERTLARRRCRAEQLVDAARQQTVDQDTGSLGAAIQYVMEEQGEPIPREKKTQA